MKFRRGVVAGVVSAVVLGGMWQWAGAADHRDSMALTADAKADIADVYSFVSPTNSNRLVLAMTVDGLIPPSEVGMHRFDPDVLYQWKIDRNGDAVEDLGDPGASSRKRCWSADGVPGSGCAGANRLGVVAVARP